MYSEYWRRRLEDARAEEALARQLAEDGRDPWTRAADAALARVREMEALAAAEAR